MHLEILIEDQSGKKALEALVSKIIEPPHTCTVHAYKGIGHVPRNMKDTQNADKRILLDCLPKLLKGYGATFAGYGASYPAAVVVVCDLDTRCLKTFRQQLLGILAACDPRPETRFCFAIEEGEAWLLGDLDAVKRAYPRAKDSVLSRYVNDSICGTWETLADAVYPGGSTALKESGWQNVGAEKSRWAEAIAPLVDAESNRSPSFCYFRAKIRELIKSRSEPARAGGTGEH